MKPFLFLFVLFYSMSFFCQKVDSLSIIYEGGKRENALKWQKKQLSKKAVELGVGSLAYAEVKQEFANVSFRFGDVDRAKELYWDVALILRENFGEDTSLYIKAISKVAYLYELKGNFIIAKRMYDQCLTTSKLIGGKQSVLYAEQLVNLGRLAEINDDYLAAEEYYKRSNTILKDREGPGTLVYASSLADQAHLYFLKGYYTASEALFRQSKYIFEKNKVQKSADYANTISFLAQLDHKLNNTIEAISLLTESIEIFERVYSSHNPFYAKSLRELASVYITIHQPEKVKGLLERALTIYKESYGEKHLEYLETIAMQARFFSQIGENQKSDSLTSVVLDYYEKYLGVDHLSYADVELDLAQNRYKEGLYEEAIGINQRIIDLYKVKLDPLHPNYAKTINNLALLYWAKDDKRKALRYYRENIKNYVSQYKRYFPFLSEKEKGYFYDGIQLFFEEFNSFSVEQMNDNPEILSLMYNSEIATKSLLFLATKDVREHVGDNPVLLDKYQRWVQTKELLAKISKIKKGELEKRGINIEELERTANYLEKEISLRVETQKEVDDVIFDVTWEDIQSALKPGEAAIEMFQFDRFLPDSGGRFLDRSYYAALIVTKETKGHPDIVLLKNGKELEENALQAYKNFIKYQIIDKKNYRLFLKPILESPHLLGIKKLYFSPDGVYNQINLNSLYNPAEDKFVLDQVNFHFIANTKDVLHINEHSLTSEDFQNGDFSCDLVGFADFHMNPHTGTESDAHLSTDKKSSEDLLTRGGIGDVFRGGDGIAELPGTKIEVESIKAIFDEHNSDVSLYMGGDANEGNLKKIQSPEILHIATHGFFMKDKVVTETQSSVVTRGGIEIPELNHEENPLMRSGIMLASASHAYSEQTLRDEIEALVNGDQVEDGILTAYEAMSLNLSETELVVLSACETGLGVVKNGEGVYGLQRSLQTAGARSIIMSLWKVSDEATQKFMVAFYKEWFKTGDKREAFLHAQQIVRREYESPYYWGAFVLVGH